MNFSDLRSTLLDNGERKLGVMKISQFRFLYLTSIYLKRPIPSFVAEYRLQFGFPAERVVFIWLQLREMVASFTTLSSVAKVLILEETNVVKVNVGDGKYPHSLLLRQMILRMVL